MKSVRLMCVTAIAVFAALANPVRVTAQDQGEENKKPPH